MSLDEARTLARDITAEVGRAVIGQDAAVRHMLIALLSRGHVLLEGPPGTAKTFLAQCFASTLGLDFRRIQFTPDMMPGDITGSNLFDFRASTFTLTRGPVFTDLLLADEINRAPPKTQAALLEAMQERAVTLDGTTHPLSERFLVVATQNPLEHQGVYPLPEAQLDRFLFKLAIDYPDEADELRVVTQHGATTGMTTPAQWGVATVADAARIAAAAALAEVTLVEEVVRYIVALVRRTRTSAALASGASTRAGTMLAAAARAAAALDDRDYVLPDDVRALAPAVLRHRLVLSPAAEVDGQRIDDVLAGLIAEVEAPR